MIFCVYCTHTHTIRCYRVHGGASAGYHCPDILLQFIWCHLIYGVHIFGNSSHITISIDSFLSHNYALCDIANVHQFCFFLIPAESIAQALQILLLIEVVRYFTSLFVHKINNYLLYGKKIFI